MKINKPKLLIFDVNETLLDLSPLKTAINNAFQNDTAFDSWFSQLLQYSLVETTTEHFQDFGTIGKAAIQMLAEKHHVHITQDEIKDLLSWIKKLPPHTDVIEGLRMLQESEFRLVALTNGTMEVAEEQLQFSGLEPFFEQTFSVESVRHYKPHGLTYLNVLRQMDIPASDAMMVACHAWDITGAQRVGLQGCFISRPGMFWYPLEKKPLIIADTIIGAAEKLMTHFGV
ncbi:haloacid dehalogenase type II [Aquiflexum sp.]|uniref:haloacid dehalogenase type II n=1 Tax=Aquiflexum sp. TaxID=1872584 RepID=UPI00359454A9